MHDYYYDKCVHQVDARRGGGHILALDQGGATIHSKSYQGLAHLYLT